jgi:hypothetical protein
LKLTGDFHSYILSFDENDVASGVEEFSAGNGVGCFPEK